MMSQPEWWPGVDVHVLHPGRQEHGVYGKHVPGQQRKGLFDCGDHSQWVAVHWALQIVSLICIIASCGWHCRTVTGVTPYVCAVLPPEAGGLRRPEVPHSIQDRQWILPVSGRAEGSWAGLCTRCSVDTHASAVRYASSRLGTKPLL